MQILSIKELLIILRDLIKDRTHIRFGLCREALILLKRKRKININDYYTLINFIGDNRPKKGRKFYRKAFAYKAYYWELGEVKIRVDWLNYKIKQL